MLLPNNAADILAFLGHKALVDFEVQKSRQGMTLVWLSQKSQPTEAEILSAGQSAAFVVWRSERDTEGKRRKLAAIDEVDSPVNEAMRAYARAVAKAPNKSDAALREDAKALIRSSASRAR